MLNRRPECHAKQLRIDRLAEENRRLRDQLGRQQRKARAGFFGSSTPSAKVSVKGSSPDENRQQRGGAKPGHKGRGRRSITEEQADHVPEVAAPVGDICPHCQGTQWVEVKTVSRGVIEGVPLKAEKRRSAPSWRRWRRC